MAACTIKGEYPVQAQAPALCGTLRVPEDRSKPDGRQTGLRVAVVPAVATDPEPDPLFVEAGGPGDPGTQFFAWLPAGLLLYITLSNVLSIVQQLYVKRLLAK